MTTQLEGEIIASLLVKPRLYQTVTLQAQWFTDPRYQQIFSAIETLGGRFTSIFEVARLLQTESQPPVRVEFLSELKESLVTTEHFRYKVRQLEQTFLEKKLQTVCVDYSRQPKPATLEMLETYAQLLQGKRSETENGELQPVLQHYQQRLFEDDTPETIKTFPFFDQLLGGLAPGMLFTIGARPSVGKTAFAAINLVLQALAQNTSLAVDIFTLEMTKREVLQRLLANLTQIEGKRLRQPARYLSPAEIQTVQGALELIASYDLRVYDHSYELQGICQEIRQHVETSGQEKHLVVIDYLGLITVRQHKNSDRRLQIEEITRQLKLLANELGIAIVLLSQLNRGIEGRAEKTPLLSDLRESGSIEQDSNVVGFLYPTDQTGEVAFILRKNREGRLAKICFAFDGSTMTFTEVQGR